jgi:hypothetical protein
VARRKGWGAKAGRNAPSNADRRAATHLLKLQPVFRLTVTAPTQKGRNAVLWTILIILLVLLLIGALPRWGHSANWGYGPSGLLGIVLIIVVILLLTGNL